MKWTDTQRIAEELYDLHGDSIDPKTVRFTQLRDLIMALPDFDDDPARCGERILEAVQQAWIEGNGIGLNRPNLLKYAPFLFFRRPAQQAV